ncbi:uncharacterized protein TNCV_505561 [Trichonephila clavipes]|nr:uncharacterized protein TNCV_505561 [Trichonephila clavipes]
MDQEPTDFTYDLLKIHKKLGLDYVEVRNPETAAQLLEVLAKFEERYSCKKMEGSRNRDNVERRGVFNETGRQRNQWFESRNGLNRDDRRFDKGYQSGNRVKSENFGRGDHRNRGSSTNFVEHKELNVGIIELNMRIKEFVKPWMFHVLADLEYPCIFGVDFISGSKIVLDFDRKALDRLKKLLQRSRKEKCGEIDLTKTGKDGITTDETKVRAIVETKPPKNSKEDDKVVLKLAEFNTEWENRPGTQNAVTDVLSRNPVESIVEQVNCAIIRDLVLSSREQLIEEQRKDPELGHIYRYLENPEDSSVNATICENWSRDFRLIEGLLFYEKYATTLGEMRVCIPKSLKNEIMTEFHEKPIAGHLGRFTTYHK